MPDVLTNPATMNPSQRRHEIAATRHRIGCHFAASSLAPPRCPREWFTAPNREAKSTFGVSVRR